MELFIAFLLLVIASALVPIAFGVIILYMIWRILKKKEWV